MNKSKTHTLIVRGVKKEDKNKLKSIAKINRLSVNSIMLHSIDFYLGKFPKESGVLPHPWNIKFQS